MKKLLKNPIVYKCLDVLFLPFTLVGGAWLRIAKYIGLSRLYLTRKSLFRLGVFPIVDHYYEPLYRFDKLNHFDRPRTLDLDWNEETQLDILSRFQYASELERLPNGPSADGKPAYHYKNPSYSGIDAEYLYSLVRLTKPKRIIEIGSGFSTLMMLEAIKVNESEKTGQATTITCVEPYEMPWLEQTGVEVIRKKVEELPLSFFESLNENDILFIDSSHVIRPEGDVLYEMFNILPVLKPGVVIHIHDIFSPFDYPERWMKEEFRMWNEQYLLEALLMNSKKYEIIGALSYIGDRHPQIMQSKFPLSAATKKLRGSAMWIRKSGQLTMH